MDRWKLLFTLFGLWHVMGFSQVSRPVSVCTLPVGRYVSADIPPEEWQLEIKEREMIETIDNGKAVIISKYAKDLFSNCRFRVVVGKIIGEDEDIKIGDRFIVEVIEFQKEHIVIRTENNKFGVILTLLKLK